MSFFSDAISLRNARVGWRWLDKKWINEESQGEAIWTYELYFDRITKRSAYSINWPILFSQTPVSFAYPIRLVAPITSRRRLVGRAPWCDAVDRHSLNKGIERNKSIWVILASSISARSCLINRITSSKRGLTGGETSGVAPLHILSATLKATVPSRIARSMIPTIDWINVDHCEKWAKRKFKKVWCHSNSASNRITWNSHHLQYHPAFLIPSKAKGWIQECLQDEDRPVRSWFLNTQRIQVEVAHGKGCFVFGVWLQLNVTYMRCGLFVTNISGISTNHWARNRAELT